jgi:hypothetical protein
MNEELLFTFLREGYYPDLTKAPGIYDAFDCISMQAGHYIELKCRATHYDTLLIDSWGYDQTNINFYQVVGITDKSVKLREIKSHQDDTRVNNDYQSYQLPSIDQFINTEKPMIRRVHKTSYNNRPFCIISRTSGCAYLYEGKSLMATSYA